jgi:hypothetical protein
VAGRRTGYAVRDAGQIKTLKEAFRPRSQRAAVGGLEPSLAGFTTILLLPTQLPFA